MSKTFVEPFFGSGAVLLRRPNPVGTETVNDADGLVCNFWRAVRGDPKMVAEHADNPVSECDLHARHVWLVGKRDDITARLMGDPEFFDAKAAGWWAWGINCWIGRGWCSGEGPWTAVDGRLVRREGDGHGVNKQCPHLGDAGKGVNKKRPRDGVQKRRPHLGTAGHGANKRRRGGKSGGECELRREWLTEWMRKLADRLRNVRVCCGDWSRVCGPSATFTHGRTAVFLDPPYADTAGRDADLYAIDCQQVAHQAREWAVENGDNPLMRIILAGYEGEHIMPPSWRKHEWATNGGYANQGADKSNRKRERLWMSPYCISLQSRTPLFDSLGQSTNLSE